MDYGLFILVMIYLVGFSWMLLAYIAAPLIPDQEADPEDPQQE